MFARFFHRRQSVPSVDLIRRGRQKRQRETHSTKPKQDLAVLRENAPTLLAFPVNRFYNPNMLAFQLHQLQEIDTARDRLRSEIAALEQHLADRSALAQAEAALQAAADALRAAQKDLRQIEAEAEAVRAKLRRTEDTLYSGRVRNPKELQDLQKEAEALQHLLAMKEDIQLSAMLAAEEAQAAYDAAAAQMEEARHQRLQDEARWGGEREERLKALQKLEARREALIATIPADTLKVYAHLRQKHHGLAVATVTDGACDACGAPLTPDRLRQARSDESLAFCQTCKRILYVP